MWKVSDMTLNECATDRVSASVKEITVSGDVEFFCKRAARGQLLPFLWNNSGGLPQSICLPENTALKIFGQEYTTLCGFVSAEPSAACAKCRGVFNLWIPLQAQTPPNNTKDYQRTLASLLEHF